MARRRSRRSAGEGAVYERPERGTWVAALIMGFDAHGRPVRCTKTINTKGAAQTWLLEQQAALRGGSGASCGTASRRTTRRHATRW